MGNGAVAFWLTMVRAHSRFTVAPLAALFGSFWRLRASSMGDRASLASFWDFDWFLLRQKGDPWDKGEDAAHMLVSEIWYRESNAMIHLS